MRIPSTPVAITTFLFVSRTAIADESTVSPDDAVIEETEEGEAEPASSTDREGPPRPGPLPPPPPPPRKGQWYGEQILALDAVALGTMITGALTNPTLVAAGAGIYALGPPTVHVAHGSPRAPESLGLRVAGPIGGGAIGFAVGLPLAAVLILARDPRAFRMPLATGLIGAGIGYVTAIIVDAAAFARAPAAAPPETNSAPPRTARAPRPTIVPTLDPGRERITIGLRGTF
jgi:hypothetical protein